MDIKKLIVFTVLMLVPFLNYTMEISPEQMGILVLKAEITDLKNAIIKILDGKFINVITGKKTVEDINKEIKDNYEQMRKKIKTLQEQIHEVSDIEFIKNIEDELKNKFEEELAGAEEKKERTFLDLLDDLYAAILAETQFDRLAEQEEDEVKKEGYEYKRDRAQKRRGELESELKEITKNFSEQMYSSLQDVRELLEQRNNLYDSLFEQSKKVIARKKELRAAEEKEQTATKEKEQKIISDSIKRIKENQEADRRQVEALDQKIIKLGNDLQKMMGAGEMKEASIKKPMPKGETAEKKPERPVPSEYRAAAPWIAEEIKVETGVPLDVFRRIGDLIDEGRSEEKIKKIIKREYPGRGYEKLVRKEQQRGEGLILPYEAYAWGIGGISPVPAPSRTVSVPSRDLGDLLTDLRNRLRTMKGSFGR
jgi:chromosome segregation ATPase